MAYACRRHIQNCDSGPIFGNSDKSASTRMAEAINVVVEQMGTTSHCRQGHALKRGTVSALVRLGVSSRDVNLHVGWALNSTMLETYFRMQYVETIDR